MDLIKVAVPMFINCESEIMGAMVDFGHSAKAEEGDHVRAFHSGFARDEDGWPLKVYTIEIVRKSE